MQWCFAYIYMRICTKNIFRTIKLALGLSFWLCDSITAIALELRLFVSFNSELRLWTNVEKTTNEMLAGLSEGSSDSEDFDVESDDENTEDRPWRLSHVVLGKSTVKRG